MRVGVWRCSPLASLLFLRLHPTTSYKPNSRLACRSHAALKGNSRDTPGLPVITLSRCSAPHLPTVSPPPTCPPPHVAPLGSAFSISFPRAPPPGRPLPSDPSSPPLVSRSLAAFPGALAEPPRVGGSLAELGPSPAGGEGGAGAQQSQRRPGRQPGPSKAPPHWPRPSSPAPALAAARPRQAEPQERRRRRRW